MVTTAGATGASWLGLALGVGLTVFSPLLASGAWLDEAPGWALELELALDESLEGSGLVGWTWGPEDDA